MPELLTFVCFCYFDKCILTDTVYNWKNLYFILWKTKLWDMFEFSIIELDYIKFFFIYYSQGAGLYNHTAVK